MIHFIGLIALAVLFKLLTVSVYTPLTVAVAVGLFALRYGLSGVHRASIDTFLLSFGVMIYALANRDPSFHEQLALVICVLPSLSKLKAIGRLAVQESSGLVLLIYMAWSCVWSSNLSMTLSGVLMSAMCLGFVFGYVLTFEGELQRIFEHVLFILCVLVVSSILVGIMGHDAVGRTFAGVTFHRNQFGLLLGLMILLSLYLLRQPPRWIRPVLLAGSAALLWYIDSKSAIIGIAVAVIIWWVANSRWWRLWTAMAAVALVVFVVTLPSPKMDNFALRMGRDPTFTSRRIIWDDSLKFLAEQPFTGYGYNAVWDAYENRLAQYPEAPGPKYAHAFNAWLDWGLQLGLGGLALYLVFLGTLVLRAWCAYRAGWPARHCWQAVCLVVYIEIYNLANVSTVPINRFGFFMLAITTTCLLLALRPKMQPQTQEIGRVAVPGERMHLVS